MVEMVIGAIIMLIVAVIGHISNSPGNQHGALLYTPSTYSPKVPFSNFEHGTRHA